MLFSYLGFDPFHTEKVIDVFDTKTAAGRDAMQNRCHVARIFRAAKSAIQDACLASIFLFFPSFLSERSEVLLLLAYFVMPILARSRHTHTQSPSTKTECALYTTTPAFSGSCQPSMPGSIYLVARYQNKLNPNVIPATRL